MNGPGARTSDAENGPNSRRFDNRAKRLVVVNAVALGVTANNTARLVTSECAIGVVFMFINPLASQNICAGRARHKTSGVVVEEGLVFVDHSLPPVSIRKSTAVIDGMGETEMAERFSFFTGRAMPE